VRHSYPSGAAPRPWRLLGVWALLLVACLNPRPEELPSQESGENLGGDANSTGSGESSGPASGNPAAPTPVQNSDNGLTDPSPTTGGEANAGGGGSANEAPAADAGVDDEPADAGGG
jgi:hypothetical protein